MHLVIVAYDINTTTSIGKARLRKVSKLCESYGTRIQYSLFECYIDARQYTDFKSALNCLLDTNTDQIRFYRLGKNFTSKIEILGMADPLSYNEPFIY